MSVTTQENESIVTRFADNVWNDGNLDTLEELAATDISAHFSGVGEIEGREAYGDAVQLYRSAFPDFTVEIDEMLSVDDTVVIRYTVYGTHEGELMGVSPTGTDVEIGGITIVRLEDGMVVEEWNQGDMLGMLQQIGAVPTQTPA